MMQENFVNEVVQSANVIFLQLALKNGENSITENVAGKETKIKELEIESYTELIDKSKKEIRTNNKLKKILCGALKSVSSDLTEIAKIVCASVIPLIIADKMFMPMNSLLLAGISVVIFNSGISSICQEFDKKLNDGK